MALPNSLVNTAPAGSDSPSQGDDQIRAKTLALEDILGIPDNTNITQAAFDIDAGGLAQAIFYDVTSDPASGELGRNGSALKWRIADSRTNSVVEAFEIIADTSGSPAAGIGTRLTLSAESGDETPCKVVGFDGVLSDVTAGSEDSYASILLRVAGAALDEKYRFASTAGAGFTAIFTHAATADRTYTLPDASITLAGGPLAVQTFTSSGTYTPTAGTSVAIVEVWGSGAGGAGSNGSAANPGGGGGGGGYSLYRYASPAAQTVTINAGGAAGTAGNPGAVGGTVSFGAIITTNTQAAGGISGGAGGAGGIMAGGDLNLTGAAGSGGVGAPGSTAASRGGPGGAAPRMGIFGPIATSTGSAAATNSGGGGSGGGYTGAADTSGGAGAAGIIIVTEY